MAFTTLGTMAQDDAITVDYLNQIKTNEDDLNSRVTTMAALDVPNGGFEVDTDSDGIPDNWSEVSAPSGGSKGIETSAPIQGAQSFYQSRTSGASNHGGVYASDYIACDEQRSVRLMWQMRTSAAGITCKVDLYWYKKDKTACTTASTNIYNSAANPTSNTVYRFVAKPPTDARFFKIRLSLTNGTDVAGTVYWDGFSMNTEYSFTASIAEQTEISLDPLYHDQSGTITVPYFAPSGMVVRLAFSASARNYGGVANSPSMRFRIGTYYSNVLAATYGAWATGVFTLNYVSTGGGETMYMQLNPYWVEGPSNCRGKKDSGPIMVEF